MSAYRQNKPIAVVHSMTLEICIAQVGSDNALLGSSCMLTPATAAPGSKAETSAMLNSPATHGARLQALLQLTAGASKELSTSCHIRSVRRARRFWPSKERLSHATVCAGYLRRLAGPSRTDTPNNRLVNRQPAHAREEDIYLTL